MPNLYYTNAGGTTAWSTLSNWNTAADGSGSSPTSIPWVDGYFDYDLVYSNLTNATIALDTGTISPLVTGSCSINFASINVATSIYGGTYLVPIGFNSESAIYGGTYLGGLWAFELGIEINGGDFSQCPFLELAHAAYSISGGTFYTEIWLNIVEAQITFTTPNSVFVTQGGLPFTGEWFGQLWLNGVIDPGFVVRNIVPRAAGQGSLGTSSLPWNQGHFYGDVAIGGNLTAANIPTSFFSGAYADLTGKPTLGTAAAQNATSFDSAGSADIALATATARAVAFSIALS